MSRQKSAPASLAKNRMSNFRGHAIPRTENHEVKCRGARVASAAAAMRTTAAALQPLASVAEAAVVEAGARSRSGTVVVVRSLLSKITSRDNWSATLDLWTSFSLCGF